MELPKPGGGGEKEDNTELPKPGGGEEEKEENFVLVPRERRRDNVPTHASFVSPYCN